MKPIKPIMACLQTCADWGLIPTEFRQCMTWEEQVLWLSKFLNTVVLPKMNETIEATNEVQEAFIALKDYVDNYFDNLDVQEEINNKLEQMADDGELAEIIASYINTNGVISFNTVADLVANDILVEGSTARTLGFSSLNDGGGAIYKIIKEQSATGVDGRTKISLGRDDLYAVIIPKIVNVKEYGAAGDGETDDYAAIQYCVTTFPNHTLFFPNGTYLVSEGIVLPAPEDEKVYILCEPNTIIKADDSFEDDYLLSIGGSGTGGVASASVQSTGIDGGLLDCNGRCSGINIINIHNGVVKNTNLKNCSLYGITVSAASNNNSSDALIENCYVTRSKTDYNTSSVAIKLVGGDNYISNVRTVGFHTGFYIGSDSGGNTITNCHPLFVSTEDETDDHFNDAIGFDVYGGGNVLSDCYSDNFSTAIYYHNSNTTTSLTLDNFFAYWYASDADYNYTVVRVPTNSFRIKSTNLRAHIPELGTKMMLKIDNGTFPDATIITGNRASSFTDTFIDYVGRLTYKLSDPFWVLNNVYGPQFFGGADNNLTLNKWHAVALFESMPQIQDAKISLGQNIEAELALRTTGSNLSVENIKNVLNRFGSTYQIGVGQVGTAEGELRNIKIVYIKVTSLGELSSINDVTSFNVLSKSHTAKMMHIPTEMYWNSAYLREVDSIPNSLWTSPSFDDPNAFEGEFNVSKWSPSHTIKMTSQNGDKRPVLITLRYGDGVGLYMAYYDKFFKISSTGTYTEPTYSFTDNNNTLTVTNIDNSRISYVRF